MRVFKMFFLMAMCVGISACSSLNQGTHSAESPVLRHVVAFKFKPDVTPEQMQKVSEDFRALKGKVPQIIDFEGGPHLDLGKRSEGFTHVFIVTVKDEKDLAGYGVHPDHKAFSNSVDPLLEEVMVVDYWK